MTERQSHLILEQARSQIKSEPALAEALAEQVLAQTTDPQISMDALEIQIGANEAFGFYQPKGIEAIHQLQALAAEQEQWHRVLHAKNCLITHLLSRDLARAQAEWKLAEEVAIKLHVEEYAELLLTHAYNFIQMCISKHDQLEAALTLANDKLLQAEQLGIVRLQIGFLQSLSILNAMQGNNDTCIRYMEMIIALAEKNNDHENVSGAAGYVAYMYSRAGDMDRAESRFQLAITHAELANNISANINASLRMLRMQVEKGEIEKTRALLDRLTPLIAKEGMERDKAILQMHTADFEVLCGRLEKALGMYRDLESTQFMAENKLDQVQLFQKMHALYASIEQHQEAYHYLTLFHNLRFEVFNEEKAKMLTEIQGKYDLERKEADLQRMQVLQISAELKALKSQMNPHFVFNVMSTLDQLIVQGQTAAARAAVQQFSGLMRSTLEHSDKEWVTVEEEIQLLEHYLALEQLALGSSFSWQIHCGETIDADFDRVPPMMLQPVVENAIKHGLQHQLGPKRLLILFERNEAALTIVVEDNGIGRTASAEINALRKHQSFAGAALTQRINILNQRAGWDRFSLTTTDLPLGTKVVLSIQHSL